MIKNRSPSSKSKTIKSVFLLESWIDIRRTDRDYPTKTMNAPFYRTQHSTLVKSYFYPKSFVTVDSPFFYDPFEIGCLSSLSSCCH